MGTFALLLARVAYADLHISEDEIRGMERLIVESGALSPAEAALVVEVTRVHQRLFGVTGGYLAAREFRASSTREDRLRLLDALFAVSAAGRSLRFAAAIVVLIAVVSLYEFLLSRSGLASRQDRGSVRSCSEAS